MLKGQSLLDYTNLFCPYDYEKNDRVVLTEKVQSMSLLQNLIKLVILNSFYVSMSPRLPS